MSALENFEDAKAECLTGHQVGGVQSCTYGGLFPTDGYWLAADVCTRNHGETCQIRAVCDGADSETRFCDWEVEGVYIWGVYACLGCAQDWVGEHPQWVSTGRTRDGEDG